MPGHRACELPIHHNQLTHAEPPPELFCLGATKRAHRCSCISRSAPSNCVQSPPKKFLVCRLTTEAETLELGSRALCLLRRQPSGSSPDCWHY